MKKVRMIIFTAVACIFIAACALCVQALDLPVFASERALCVVLDAGHGGIDGGVTGKSTGVKESELNLKITLKLKKLLDEAGFDVVLTRKTDAGLYDAATKGFKKRDMQKRKEIIEEAKPVMMISVHQNFYPTSSSRGGQVFYRSGSESGRFLAEGIQKSFNRLYKERGVAERKISSGDYFMLKCTPYTSVIAECGFLSSADEGLLVTDEFQENIAECIFAGMLEYLETASIVTGA